MLGICGRRSWKQAAVRSHRAALSFARIYKMAARSLWAATRQPGVTLNARRVFQNSRDLRVAARAGVLERRDAVRVGDGDIGAGLDQRLNGGSVIAAAVAEHGGLAHGRPV